MNNSQGSFRLFQFAGVNVFLHWSWFLVAAFEISGRAKSYSSLLWNVFEYLSLFLIVLAHEYGHALACRQVGGIANRIVLWPLGGIAYVDPPPRPGATLWSIAAGPLVNVALLPVTLAVLLVTRNLGWAATMPNAYSFLRALVGVNVLLLAFNLLPIYPLDGGQILRSLLWFVLGRGRSLMVATIVGFVGVFGFIVLAFWTQSAWIGIIGVFMLLNCWGGLKHAQMLLRIDKLPRRDGFACPSCRAAPPIGELWTCSQCMNRFDTFQNGAKCPACYTTFEQTMCLDCQKRHPLTEWATAPAITT